MSMLVAIIGGNLQGVEATYLAGKASGTYTFDGQLQLNPPTKQ